MFFLLQLAIFLPIQTTLHPFLSASMRDTTQSKTRNQTPGRIAATRLGQPCDTRAGRFQKGGQLHGEVLLQGPVPPPAKGVGGQEKTEKLPKYGSANKS